MSTFIILLTMAVVFTAVYFIISSADSLVTSDTSSEHETALSMM